MNDMSRLRVKSKVALVKCDTYEYSQVKQAVEQGISLLGEWDKFVSPGEKILLKPNLLAPEPPEKCVTTHPAVFRAAAEALLSKGAKVSYGDSPAMNTPERVAKKSGIFDAGEGLGLELADFKQGKTIFFQEGVQNKKFYIANGVLESDGIISLPKLKTHGLVKLTGAIKNQFGCIPGVLKGEFHVKLPDINDFARMLIDLNCLLKPRLFIMDGIMAMEGNGPRGGRPRKMGVLLFSADPVALDATVSRMVNVNPETIPTIRMGEKLGLGKYKKEDIDILGDSISNIICTTFDSGKSSSIMSMNTKWLRNLMIPRPEIEETKCIQCGICVNMCPLKPGAVDWFKDDKSLPPVYDYNRCIRCYCCQELCPEGAISLKSPRLSRLFDYFKP